MSVENIIVFSTNNKLSSGTCIRGTCIRGNCWNKAGVKIRLNR